MNLDATDLGLAFSAYQHIFNYLTESMCLDAD